MGYNLTRHSVRRNKIQLDQLLEAERSVRFPHSRPLRLANKLREAVAAAYYFEEFKHYYDKIHYHFKFRAMGDHVLAEYTGDGTVGEVVVESPKEQVKETKPEPIVAEPAPVPQSKTIPDATDLVGVLAVLIKFPNDHEIHFPNAILSEEDKPKLYEWTANNDWQYIDQGSNGTVLTKAEVPKEVLWAK